MTVERDVDLYERTLQSVLERLHDTLYGAARNAAMVASKAEVLEDAGADELGEVLRRIEDRLRALEEHAEALHAQVRSVQGGHPDVLDYPVDIRWSGEDE